MSSTASAGYLAKPALIAFADIVPLPVLVVAGISAPLWHGVLRDVSEIMAFLSALLAVVLAILKIWLATRPEKEAEAAEARASFWHSFTEAMKGAARRAQVFAVVAVAAVGVVFLVSSLFKRDANAAPVPKPAPTSQARKRARDDDADGEDADETAPIDGPPWFQRAMADLGTLEGRGKKNNPKVVAYYADAGSPEIKHDSVPWCAAFVNACLEREAIPGSKSLAARSFERWGEKCEPTLGCIVVMWRGSRTSWQGHVGFYVRETSSHVYILGGNQGDAVSIQRFPKSRVLGYRWPRNVSKLKTNWGGIGAATGAGGAAVAVGADLVKEQAHAPAVNIPASPELPASKPPTPAPETWSDKLFEVLDGVQGAIGKLAPLSKHIAVASAILGAACALYVVYRRTNDFKARGI